MAVRLARIGNKLLSAAAFGLIALLLLYGAYSIWDTVRIYQGACVSEELLQYKPSSEEEGHPTLAGLQEINPDVCGWLTVDGTHIDYPLVQGETNMDYINQDVYGDFSLSGSVFLDSRNASDFTDCYSLVYGHHMANSAMFGDVVKFTDSDYFTEHQTGTLYLTDGRTYGIQIFACVEADAFDTMFYQPDVWNHQDMKPLLAYIKDAVQYREIGVAAEDQIIGLSTCTEAETNGRVILLGRLEEAQVKKGGV